MHQQWGRFTNVTIPGGATIQSAKITVVARGSVPDGSQKTNIYAEDVDDAVAPTTKTEHDDDVRTTNFTAWDDEDFVVDAETDSPDLAAVIQEIVDRGSWLSGNSLMILWDDDGSLDGDYCVMYQYDDDTTKAMKLHVEYTT